MELGQVVELGGFPCPGWVQTFVLASVKLVVWSAEIALHQG